MFQKYSLQGPKMIENGRSRNLGGFRPSRQKKIETKTKVFKSRTAPLQCEDRFSPTLRSWSLLDSEISIFIFFRENAMASQIHRYHASSSHAKSQLLKPLVLREICVFVFWGNLDVYFRIFSRWQSLSDSVIARFKFLTQICSRCVVQIVIFM